MTPDGDVNNGPTITIVSWTECGIALVLLLARIWTRVRILNSWGWDDAFMCLAMVGDVFPLSRRKAPADLY